MPFTDIEDLSQDDTQFLLRVPRDGKASEIFLRTVERAVENTGSWLGMAVLHEITMGRGFSEAFRIGFGECGLPKAQAAFDDILYALKPALEPRDPYHWERSGCEIAAFVLAFPPEDRVIAMRAVLAEVRDYPDRAHRATFALVAQLALAEAAMARQTSRAEETPQVQ